MHEIVHAVFILRVANEREMSKKQRRKFIDDHGAHYEPFFIKTDMDVLLPDFARNAMGAELGWRFELYVFGLTFYADLTSRQGAQNMRHQNLLDPSGAFPLEPTRHESLAKFFRRRKWVEVLRRGLIAGMQSTSGILPSLRYDQDVDGNWILMFVPEAALVDPSDGLFIRHL